MAEKVKNHFVPKTHLKRFANKEGLTNSFITSNNSFVEKIPYEAQCQKRYFYGKENKVENAFGDLENRIAPILELLDKSEISNVSSEDMTHLRFYFHTLSCRTVKEEEYTNQNIRSILSYPLEKEAGYTRDEAEKVLEQAKIKSINMVLGACVKTFDLTLDLDMVLLENCTQFDFILSDNPVVKTNYIYNENNSTHNGYGFAAKGLIIIIPISPKVCICLYDKESYKRLEPVIRINKEKDVLRINSLQYLSSHKTLYFKNTSITGKLMKMIKSLRKTDRMEIKEHYDEVGSKYVFRETEGYTLKSIFSFISINKMNSEIIGNRKLSCPKREATKPMLLERYGPESLL